MSESGHGFVGTREQQFTELLPLRTEIYPTALLVGLANAVKSQPDGVHDGPDPEENLWVPSGYTYFGQFVDHDLTFDNTSSLNVDDMSVKSRQPSNLRTPRFDLDSLYGDGPDAQPFMYDADGASLLFQHGHVNATGSFAGQADTDLLRSPNGRAIIGDKRNDENVIVGQIQLLFVRYHNAVVAKLHAQDNSLTGTGLFQKARDMVRWTYQALVIKDFLPRIVQAAVLKDLQAAGSADERASCYALYDTPEKRQNLPREFVVAAYRYGHSGVRQGYRMNRHHERDIFVGSDHKVSDESLLGFKPLPASLVIDDFGRFFPPTAPVIPFVAPIEDRTKAGSAHNPNVRLQFAYKIDTNIVDPLGALPPQVMPTSPAKGGALAEVKAAIAPDTLETPNRPSLALLNLLRGNIYQVQGGQMIANVLQSKGFVQATPLTAAQLVVRAFDGHGLDAADDKVNLYRFDPIAPELQQDTPLWFYILAEAQVPIVEHFAGRVNFPETEMLNGVGALSQLGWVGGRIVAEVFYGLLDSDDESVVNAAPADWEPFLGGDRQLTFLNLAKFVEEEQKSVSMNKGVVQTASTSA